MGLFKGRRGDDSAGPKPQGPVPDLTVEQAVNPPLHLATSLAWQPEVVGAIDGDGAKMRLEGCTLRVQARPPNTVEEVTYDFFFDKDDVVAVMKTATAMLDYAVHGSWGRE